MTTFQFNSNFGIVQYIINNVGSAIEQLNISVATMDGVTKITVEDDWFGFVEALLENRGISFKIVD